jgi:hypothetical protein
MRATKQIELTPEEVQIIDSFLDVLTEIGNIASDKRTIDIFSYLISKWAYQNKSIGDSTIYIDEIGYEDLSNEPRCKSI